MAWLDLAEMGLVGIVPSWAGPAGFGNIWPDGRFAGLIGRGWPGLAGSDKASLGMARARSPLLGSIGFICKHRRRIAGFLERFGP